VSVHTYDGQPWPEIRSVGRRWTIEESFQAGKALTGLDEHQVRQWISWRRWTILAYAILAAAERADNPTPQGASLIALTCNEIHRLFNTYTAQPIPALRHRLHRWRRRRRHQHRARTSHYRRRQATPTWGGTARDHAEAWAKPPQRPRDRQAGFT
jgi:hypothetical protein